MAYNLGGYDQLSASLAESFVPYVSDNTFIANRVTKAYYESALKIDEGRFLVVPLLTAKNNTAQSFGQYDTLASGPQQLLSAASFPWSWYQGAVTIDYQTLRLVRGTNMRVDNLTLQVQAAIASLADLIGGDSTSLTKGANAQTGVPALGIVEACDNGTLYNVYGQIARTGTNALSTWSGYDVSLTAGNIGTAANDAPLNLFLAVYVGTSIGNETPTHVFTRQQGVGSYMYSMNSMIRVSPGDTANPYTADPHILGAVVIGDDHIGFQTNAGKIGYTYYYMNMNHSRMYFFGEKGFDYVPWIDTPGILSKVSRYVSVFQNASDEPRLNGYLANVNDLQNL